MKCEKCGIDYPSKYWFSISSICTECYKKLPTEEKRKLEVEYKEYQKSIGLAGKPTCVRTWSIMVASWQVLKKDKELLIFPLISGICCLLVLASFAIPLYLGGYFQDSSGTFTFPPGQPGENASTSAWVLYCLTIFMFYFGNYLVIIFFNSAIIACAFIRMGGGNPNLIDGFRASWERFELIVGWALVSATVGFLLRIIEDRFEKAGQFVAGVLGMVWTVVSFLVIPIMVVEGKGPITALKESTKLLKKTWGEQLISNVSFGLVFFFLSIPAIFLLIMGFVSGAGTNSIICLGLAVLYVIILALVQSTLQAIFQAALYLYASKRQVLMGFQEELLKDSIIVK